MLFTSTAFLYGFLPIVFLGYLLIGRASKIAWPIIHFLILASFIFYGYHNPTNILLLAISITVNFVIAKAIREKASSSILLVIGIAFNLGLLFYFKYTNFFLENIATAVSISVTPLDITLPLAISFYTFQQIAFLVDTKSGEVKDITFPNYLLFVTFFPQLIIGPIVHHKEMMPQFARQDIGTMKWDNFQTGSLYFFSGIIKKLFLSDPFATFVDQIHAQNLIMQYPNFGDAWFSAFAFSLQIYFDFSAYADMATGLAKVIGIDLPINFNSPYKAFNVAEFWRKWHITLSRWLRDYLYFPLGGNRCGFTRSIVNAFIVFFLGGLWHGAEWTFILWGLLHGAGVALSKVMEKVTLTIPPIISVALTFLFVTLSWVIFRAENMDSASSLYLIMFGNEGWDLSLRESANLSLLCLGLLIIFAVPNTHEVIPRVQLILQKLPKISIFLIIIVIWLSLSAFDLDSSAEFIYFDF